MCFCLCFPFPVIRFSQKQVLAERVFIKTTVWWVQIGLFVTPQVFVNFIFHEQPSLVRVLEKIKSSFTSNFWGGNGSSDNPLLYSSHNFSYSVSVSHLTTCNINWLNSWEDWCWRCLRSAGFRYAWTADNSVTKAAIAATT